MTDIALITPHLWFDTEAREAAAFYCSVFPESRVLGVTTLPDTPSGAVEVVEFELAGQSFQAISAGPMFKFNEAISFIVRCETQAEIDRYWDKLSAVPEAEACGWCKDRYGLSWQIVPRAMDAMMRCGDAEKVSRVVRAFLGMKKFDLAALEAAFDGR
ncbi:3-demethylubiquinone-9 3-methyltransferase [Thiocapsa sp. KS1]|nr:VOC family protein [Thiocapsa sp. KS1]CRI63204.1 3-demethylubiquinone-9 3-methyltransferase [Thiocapsa sp. KS1]